jgi:hypothetical protein
MNSSLNYCLFLPLGLAAGFFAVAAFFAGATFFSELPSEAALATFAGFSEAAG